MRNFFLVVPLLLCLNAAIAAQIETTTTENGTKTRWSVTSIGENQLMRIDEGGWGSSVTMSGEASAGSSSANVQYEKGKVQDTIIYDPNLGEVMMVEGNVCRVLSAQSAAPPGMDFMSSPEMKDHQARMAGAMADARAQMEQSGMSQAQIDAMGDVLGGFDMAEPPREDTLHFEAQEKNVSVGEFTADVYVAKTASGVEKYRFYMADIDDVPGGRAIKKGMVGMMNIYAEFMSNVGAGQLMDEALVSIMNGPRFEGEYPVAIDDLQDNSHTVISLASDDGPSVDLTPDCVKKDMMEY